MLLLHRLSLVVNNKNDANSSTVPFSIKNRNTLALHTPQNSLESQAQHFDYKT